MDDPLDVELRFPGQVQPQTATGWMLSADSYTANNAVDWNPDGSHVILGTQPIADLPAGYTERMAPVSMLAVTWEVTP